MGRRVLTPADGVGRRRGERGFTLIEVMTAMAITVTVMMANLFLFSTAAKNLAFSRSLTSATNLATEKIAAFRSTPLAGITSGADAPTVDKVQFARAWTVSSVDLDHDGTPEMVGDVVKVRLDVSWTLADKPHQVSMTTFTTGKPE